MSTTHAKRKRQRNAGFVDTFTQFVNPIDSYTKSLLHFNGPDGSINIIDELGRTWTRVGDVQIDTDQSRFDGASCLFDGTGDYLLGDGDSAQSFGTGDFTIDFWIRFANVVAGSMLIYDERRNTATEVHPTIYFNGTNFVYYIMGAGGVIISTTSPQVNTWYHIAIVRSSGITRMFINGANEGAAYTDPNNYLLYTNRPILGADGASEGSAPFHGWIDELRISKGIARWTSNFFPPTYPYGGSSLAGDLSLSHFNGVDLSYDFFDEQGRMWIPVSNTQLDTAQKKFGISSALFDGTSDFLAGRGETDVAFGTGDFTVDFWVRLAVINTNYMFIDYRPEAQGAYFTLFVDAATNKVVYYVNSTILITSTAIMAANVWTHIAVTKEANYTRLFMDGILQGAPAYDLTDYLRTGTRPAIGGNGYPAGSWSLNGWMDELRIEKGIARWVSNFTPPTTEY